MLLQQAMESRLGPLPLINDFYSVEISANGLATIYQFKLRDVSSDGACVLVKEDSTLLGYLKKGDCYNMRYYPKQMRCCPNETSGPWVRIKTEIKFVDKDRNGRYQGHYLVGLQIVAD